MELGEGLAGGAAHRGRILHEDCRRQGPAEALRIAACERKDGGDQAWLVLLGESEGKGTCWQVGLIGSCLVNCSGKGQARPRSTGTSWLFSTRMALLELTWRSAARFLWMIRPWRSVR